MKFVSKLFRFFGDLFPLIWLISEKKVILNSFSLSSEKWISISVRCDISIGSMADLSLKCCSILMPSDGHEITIGWYYRIDSRHCVLVSAQTVVNWLFISAGQLIPELFPPKYIAFVASVGNTWLDLTIVCLSHSRL